MRHNVPSSKNETCHFDVGIEIREEMKQENGDLKPIMGRSREKRDDDERQRKARKCRRNHRRKSSRKNKKNKKHKKPKTEAKIPDALQVKICAR